MCWRAHGYLLGASDVLSSELFRERVPLRRVGSERFIVRRVDPRLKIGGKWGRETDARMGFDVNERLHHFHITGLTSVSCRE
jgi:hypothetical protein